MKVLFFDPYFEGKYGNARYVADLFHHEELLDCRFYTCSPDIPVYLENLGKPERFLLLKYNQNSVLNQFGGSISKAKFIDKLIALKNAVTYSFEFKELCKRESIDVVHCNSIRAILTIGLGAKLSGSKLVLYIKSNLVGYVFCLPAFFLADRILFQTETNKLRTPKSLLYFFKSKFRILKNAIDIRRIDKYLDPNIAHKTDSFKSQPTNLVFIGSVVERKGLKYLIHALNKINQDDTDIKLHIIGDHNADTVYTSELNNLIKASHLQDKVMFLGHIEEPLAYLSDMHFLVLPSLDEGVPKSVIESICMGIPVIATDVGGTREVIFNYKNGMIVQPENVDDLYNAIKECLENADKIIQLTRSESDNARKEFSFSTHSKNLSLIYKELIS